MHDSTQLRNVMYTCTTLQCMIIMIIIDDDMHMVYKTYFTVAGYCMTSSLMLAFLQPFACMTCIMCCLDPTIKLLP